MSVRPPFSSTVAGVVFDLDGVLIDSHDQHEASWFRLAKEIDKPLTREQFKESFGMRNESCIPGVFGWTDAGDRDTIRALGDRKEELYRELLRESGLEPLPGVVSLLEGLTGEGVPVSVGSSTSRRNIEVCLGSTGLDRFFGTHYTGAEDVSRGKPAPDVFLEAARKIEREPSHCAVIEDAHVGVEAALAAGMVALAVTTTHPASSFSGGGAARIAASLEEVDAAAILALIEANQ